jgi:biopolymer transport protein ExbD
MIKIKKRKIPDADIPSGSMADISFLLLLFFLVSSNIDVDTGIGMTLPEYQENAPTTEISKDRMATLLVNEGGQVLLSDKVISIPQIRANLIERITSKINLPKNKKLIVSIKTDRKTNYNLYIQTLDQVKSAYFEVRETYSMSKFGRKVIDLNEEEMNEIKEAIPIIISIAEPEKV